MSVEVIEMIKVAVFSGLFFGLIAYVAAVEIKGNK